jgi:SAM-dependent MidA family methyltransferase
MSSRPPSLTLPQPPPELADLSRQLCTRIIKEIENGGPMPFDRYMAMALYQPGLGYYVNGLHKFGATGDFVTAPEQGPLFARALARQLDEIGEALGQPWTLLELGAGSGVLARELLVSMRVPPARYLILEPSAVLREVQQETLTLPAGLRNRIEWVDQPPTEPFSGMVLANEVIDALPVSRFRLENGRMLELAVDVVGDRLGWTAKAPTERLNTALQALAERLPHTLTDGFESDICLDLGSWLATVTAPLQRGVALFIDYGYPRADYYHPDRSGGTLVCHYRHRAHFDPFVWPGLTDLSAFVDFTATAEAAVASGLEVSGYTTQAGFLLSLGIAEAVSGIDNERERLKLAAEIKRLTLPGEMGEKFKVLALTRNFNSPLSGFTLINHLPKL